MGGRPRNQLAIDPQRAFLAVLASAQNGVVGREQLLATGIGRSRIDTWLRDGRLVAIHRGVYLVATPIEPPFARQAATLLACGERSAIGFWEAARLHRLPLGSRERRRPGEPIDVCIAGPHRAHRAGVRIHHTRTLRKTDVVEIASLRVTSAARTICDLAPSATPRRLEALVAEALFKQRFEEYEFARFVHGSSFAGAPKLRAILDAGPRMTRSEGESILNAHLDAAGLPRARTQFEIRGCEFDFVWPRERVVLELDRASAHSRTRTKQRDDHKALVLVEAGWPPPLHVTGSRLRSEPDRIVAAIAAALHDAALAPRRP